MNRLQRKLKYQEQHGYNDEFYGEWNFDNFHQKGCVILKDFEPFKMLEITNIIYNWFNNEMRYPTEKKDNEVLITLPETLFSLHSYMEKELDSLSRLKFNLFEGIGFNKDYMLSFINGIIPLVYIYNCKYHEVSYVMFKEKDVREFHNFFFTPEVYIDRSSRGMD
ncbi:hypothetical protein [Tenacibaculum sp. A30]|uniref:hypothetical protein n=1 Tax=Tenacibaculum sp. A30 TaxID=3442644 RepID=UPI003EB8151C